MSRCYCISYPRFFFCCYCCSQSNVLFWQYNWRQAGRYNLTGACCSVIASVKSPCQGKEASGTPHSSATIFAQQTRANLCCRRRDCNSPSKRDQAQSNGNLWKKTTPPHTRSPCEASLCTHSTFHSLHQPPAIPLCFPVLGSTWRERAERKAHTRATANRRRAKQETR